MIEACDSACIMFITLPDVQVHMGWWCLGYVGWCSSLSQLSFDGGTVYPHGGLPARLYRYDCLTQPEACVLAICASSLHSGKNSFCCVNRLAVHAEVAHGRAMAGGISLSISWYLYGSEYVSGIPCPLALAPLYAWKKSLQYFQSATHVRPYVTRAMFLFRLPALAASSNI